MSTPTKIECEHYAKLIGRQITAIQWEEMEGQALPVLVLSGWDVSAPKAGGRLAMTVPVARNTDGTPIVGLSLEEFVIDRADVLEQSLSYPAAERRQGQSSLTVRAHYEDPPMLIPADGWEFLDDQRVRLLPGGTPFRAGSLYELTYLSLIHI